MIGHDELTDHSLGDFLLPGEGTGGGYHSIVPGMVVESVALIEDERDGQSYIIAWTNGETTLFCGDVGYPADSHVGRDPSVYDLATFDMRGSRLDRAMRDRPRRVT